MKGLLPIILNNSFGSWRGVLMNYGFLLGFLGLKTFPSINKLMSEVDEARKLNDPELLELIQLTGSTDILDNWNIFLTSLVCVLSVGGLRGELRSGMLSLLITRVTRGTYFIGNLLGVILMAGIYLLIGFALYLWLSWYFTSGINPNVFGLIALQSVTLIFLIPAAFIFGLLLTIRRGQILIFGAIGCAILFPYFPYLDRVPSLVLGFIEPATLGTPPTALMFSSQEFPWMALGIVTVERFLYAITLTLIGLAIFERTDIPSKKTD